MMEGGEKKGERKKKKKVKNSEGGGEKRMGKKGGSNSLEFVGLLSLAVASCPERKRGKKKEY